MNEENAWDGSERRAADRWHVGKEVPIALLIAVLVQTGGGIWWLAQLSAKIDNAVATLSEFRIERYTREDARRDRELIITLLEQQKQRDADNERRITSLEASVDVLRRAR